MNGAMGPDNTDNSSLYEDESGNESTNDQNEGGENTSESTVIPKTSVPDGTKVGDTITFRVTEDYGDEFGLEPVSGNKSSDNSMMGMSKEDLASMDETD